MKDRNQKDLELFEPFQARPEEEDLRRRRQPSHVAGGPARRTWPAKSAKPCATSRRNSLIVSSDCGFGRQGCNREIAFYKASAIAQGSNIVRRELGLPVTEVPAADPMLQMDVVPGRVK